MRRFTTSLIFFMLVAFVASGQQAFSADPKTKGGVKEAVDECVEPAAGPIANKGADGPNKAVSTETPASPLLAKVGGPAPNFEAPGYVNGGFKNIKLSDYKGKWVVLCFYPGDFTFV